MVVGAQSELAQRQGLGRGQQAHHHVFEAVVGGNGGHAQFQLVLGAELGEVDLPVLGFAALGDVQLAHDLDARHHRAAVRGWQLKVGRHDTVFAEPDFDFVLAGLAFNVNVRNVLVHGLDDHVVDQSNQ